MDEEDRALSRALLSFIFERQALRSINTNRIFQSFLECHKYRHLTMHRNNIELMLLFHEDILPNLHQFEFPNPKELAFYEAYNYEFNLGPVLRTASTSASHRLAIDKALEQDNENDANVETLRAITANQFRDAKLNAKQAADISVPQVDICASFIVATLAERHAGKLLSVPEVRKRLLELRSGLRTRTVDDDLKPSDYGLLVNNKKRALAGLSALVLRQSSRIATPLSAATNSTGSSPLASSTPFLIASDFSSIEDLERHLQQYDERASSMTQLPVQRGSVSPRRQRRHSSASLSAGLVPQLGRLTKRRRSKTRLRNVPVSRATVLATIPEQLVMEVREREQLTREA